MDNFIDKFANAFNSGELKTIEGTRRCCEDFYKIYMDNLKKARNIPEVTITKSPEEIRNDARKAIKDCTDSYRETAADLPRNDEER